MSKKDDFRLFVQSKPHLASYVENGSMTWQKFYEMYDLYGESNSIWDKYTDIRNINSIGKLTDIVKNVDMESIKTHINTAQKALGIVQDLTTKNANDALHTISNLKKGPTTPRPLNKFFED